MHEEHPADDSHENVDPQRGIHEPPPRTGAGDGAELPPPEGFTAQPPDPDALTGAITELTAQIREHHDRAAARERTIDHLHAEVERLRAGERRALLRPVITDLQHLRRDLLHQVAEMPAEVTRRQLTELLSSYALTVEQALERCGTEPLRVRPGETFSAREHRAVARVPAQHPDQDGTVAAVLADGYRDATTERVTAPARVHVHQWTPPEPADARQEQENPDV